MAPVLKLARRINRLSAGLLISISTQSGKRPSSSLGENLSTAEQREYWTALKIRLSVCPCVKSTAKRCSHPPGQDTENVDFKLHAPYRTMADSTIKNREL